MEKMAENITELQRLFVLDGESIRHRATGKEVRFSPSPKDSYGRVNVTGAERRYSVLYHRLKFILAHGWAPHRVDHRDRVKLNNLLSNLRAATQEENGRNAKPRFRPTWGDLPRGVYFRKDCPRNPFQALVTLSGGRRTLGYFPTADAASREVEAALAQHHGEFYRCPDQKL